ncbi:PorT family protein [bacterium]|nr:PorT family protein [bacterium]
MWKTFTFVLLFLPTFIARAQIISGYGIKLGMVSSKQRLETGKERNTFQFRESFYRDLEPRRGPQMAFFIDFLSIPHLRIQTELNYLQKGAEEKFQVTTAEYPEGTGEFFTADVFQFDYIALNFSVQPEIMLGLVNPYGIIGPSFNFLIANRASGPFIGTKKFTPAIILGAGIELLKPFDFPLLFEVRYNPDLEYFFENENLRSKLQVLQFVIGVKLKS